MRAMKIGLERIQMKIDTNWKIVEWMVELAPTLTNRCLAGHDWNTQYARLMGKSSSKEIVQIVEKVLAERACGRHSRRKQALQTRCKDAGWVGIAKMSIVIPTDGSHAIRCRTTKRKPKDARCDGKFIPSAAQEGPKVIVEEEVNCTQDLQDHLQDL